jgi:hypothetical protein
MGQYHIPVNIDRREVINPHLLSSGLKMLEWGQGGGTTVALTVLLACSHNRGGGDLSDYTEPGDPGTDSLYEMSEGVHPYEFVGKTFKDISLACREVILMDDWIAEDIPAELPEYLLPAAAKSIALQNL